MFEGRSRFDAESLLVERLMECLECGAPRIGSNVSLAPSSFLHPFSPFPALPLPPPPLENGCPRESRTYPLATGQTGPCRGRSRIYGHGARPNWADRARCVLLSAIDHVGKRRRDFTQRVFEGERYSGGARENIYFEITYEGNGNLRR